MGRFEHSSGLFFCPPSSSEHTEVLQGTVVLTAKFEASRTNKAEFKVFTGSHDSAIMHGVGSAPRLMQVASQHSSMELENDVSQN